MIRLMFAAFGTAGLADFRAYATNVLRKPRTATHKRRSTPANHGAVAFEANALGHLADVRFT